MDDVGRLRDRVLKLQTHFDQASEDVQLYPCLRPTRFETRARIENLRFDPDDEDLMAT